MMPIILNTFTTPLPPSRYPRDNGVRVKNRHSDRRVYWRSIGGLYDAANSQFCGGVFHETVERFASDEHRSLWDKRSDKKLLEKYQQKMGVRLVRVKPPLLVDQIHLTPTASLYAKMRAFGVLKVDTPRELRMAEEVLGVQYRISA